MGIIALKEDIRKFFFEKHFDFLTSVPQRRIQEIILSSCMKGNSGKMTDYAESGAVHRTTYGHFLSKGKWDDKKLEETQKRESSKCTMPREIQKHTKSDLLIRMIPPTDF